ncbi:MRG/MORF4L-binding protein-like isoform X2 [Anopheles stephensi]|uniref:MRG-binding protein n=1 Tax=Anopheles stephensi TaxID=30069 RepID=A0A182Y1L3_ANOST|nr:MRG/MORF4L-binding protein-like isoform X2 [Anopheles stephensi]
MSTVLREKQEIEHSEWSPEEEVQLFLAMEGAKPVGINKHFYMACIVERLSKSLQREIASDAVWSHLRTIYNLKALDELEPMPFLNEECDFCLPESEFSAAFAKRRLEDSERGTTATVPGEHDSKKVETKPETSITKPCASRTPVPSARQDGKDGEKEDKDTKDRGEVGTGKIKLKSCDNVGGHDVGPKRSQKRTRGSMSTEASLSNASSPANTPPNGPNTKRRRI